MRQIIRPLAAAACLTALLTVQAAVAQEIRPSASVDSNRIVIGDWLRLHLEVEHPAQVRVTFPSLKDSLQGLDIVRRDSIVRETSGDRVRERITYTITAFDSGTFVVPPLPFRYALPGESTERVAETGAIPVFVRTVAVDTSADIKDIKPPLSLAITWRELLPWLAGIAAAAALVWLAVYIIRKRRRGEKIIPEAPPLPAEEVALEALRSLESEKLWQRGRVKEYHSQLSDIVRLYLQRRFGVPAMEMVTDEILDAGRIAALETPTRRTLAKLLTLADLVKFAKFVPRPEENDESLGAAREVVERTSHSEPAAPPRPSQEVSA